MPPQTRSQARLLLGPTLAPLLFVACRSCSEPPPPAAVILEPAPSYATWTPPPLPAPVADAGPTRLSPTWEELHKAASNPAPWPSGAGVACGEARCKAGDFCCIGRDPRCLPRSRVKECLAARSVAMECDESSDCAAGQICCYGVIYEREARHVWCETPGACAPPLSAPGSFPFPGRELCARGGSCRDPRLVCLEDGDMPSGGKCVSRVGSVVCGAQKECPADRPWCLWDPGTRAAECIPRGPWERERGVNQCDGPEDCVGEPCCTAGSQSFCSMDCTEAFGFAAEVCHKDSDCPRPEVIAGSPRLVWRCVAVSEDGLPGLKQCSQSEEPAP